MSRYRVTMLPIPTSRVFRSRGGAIWWSFWVVVAAVMSVGFGDPDPSTGPQATTDALGQPVADADLQALAAALNAQ